MNSLISKTKASLPTYKETLEEKYETIWDQLKNVNLGEAILAWISTLPPLTGKNYSIAFKKLAEIGLVKVELNLQAFSLLNHETIVDEIKLIKNWSEATRQARAAAYISFTGFLQRRSQGVIRKAVSNKEGTNKTFFKVREKVTTEALNPEETKNFINAIQKLNIRDGLIAKLILHGGKRKNEVLTLQTTGIDFFNNRITFRQSKTKGIERKTVINYPSEVMKDLKDYLNNRSGLVFITRNGKQIAPHQIDRNFLKAGRLAGIPFNVTPHVLRVTLVTRLKEMKIQDTDIMKITGHANPAQLSSYDKSDMWDNATKDLKLF